jgi:hypothetical protein
MEAENMMHRQITRSAFWSFVCMEGRGYQVK